MLEVVAIQTEVVLRRLERRFAAVLFLERGFEVQKGTRCDIGCIAAALDGNPVELLTSVAASPRMAVTEFRGSAHSV
jgi:hypothetical protein